MIWYRKITIDKYLIATARFQSQFNITDVIATLITKFGHELSPIEMPSDCNSVVMIEMIIFSNSL